MGARNIFLIAFLAHFVQLLKGHSFDSCTDKAKPYGNCVTVKKDGALGIQTAPSVLLNGGHLELIKNATTCPFGLGSCRTGFAFYGWVKFYAFPSSCNSFGVYVSSAQFNIHLLGNGHLAAFAWMDQNRQWYVESPQPVELGIWYPIVLQFSYNSTLDSGNLSLWVQNQLADSSNCPEQRSYTPPSNNFVLGGDGVTTDHYANIQIDWSFWDSFPKSFDAAMDQLIDKARRTSKCSSKTFSTMPRPLQCFWLEKKTPANWATAYDLCNNTVYSDGYPFGRLARLNSANLTLWTSLASQLALAGQGSSTGFNAWLGGGKSSNWLNKTMGITGPATAPSGLTFVTPSNSTSCLAVNTKTTPWQWLEMDCALNNAYVCEMSWNCIPVNPCQNFGTCLPAGESSSICKCPSGTSGTFCEQGSFTPTCVNQCPCASKNRTCLVTNPMKAAMECQEKLTAPLKQRLITLDDYIYDQNLEQQLRDNFTMQYNSSSVNSTSGSSLNVNWNFYLKYRLYAKINNWYVKSLCANAGQPPTDQLNTAYNQCVNDFLAAEQDKDFQAAFASHNATTELQSLQLLLKDQSVSIIG